MKRAGLAAAVALASCAGTPTPGSLPPPAFARLELTLASRVDRTVRRVELGADGRGELQVTRVEGYFPRPEPPRALALEPGRLAAVVARLSALPRAEHVAVGNLGTDVELRVTGARELVHESYGSDAPELRSLFELLAEAAGPEHFDDALRRHHNRGARWVLAPAGDPLPSLRAALASATPDPDAQRLAARCAVERRAFALVPELHAAFLASFARDPNGDYWVALALLRLGDPVGLDTVLRIAAMQKPDWSLEAAAAVNDSYAEVYRKPPVPPWDFQSPDPRPAAIAEFRKFVAEHGPGLVFDLRRQSYHQRD